MNMTKTIIIAILTVFTTELVIHLTKKEVEPTKTYTHSVYHPWEKGEQYLAVLYLDSELEAFEHDEYIHVQQIYIDGGNSVRTFKFSNLELDIDSYMLEIYKGDNLVMMERGIFD